MPPELPRLAGPEGTEWQVAQRYLDARAALLPRGLTPVALTLNERGAWRLELDTGLTVWLGREQADARMARFIDTVGLIVGLLFLCWYKFVLPHYGIEVAWPWFALIGAAATFSGGYLASYLFVRRVTDELER